MAFTQTLAARWSSLHAQGRALRRRPLRSSRRRSTTGARRLTRTSDPIGRGARRLGVTAARIPSAPVMRLPSFVATLVLPAALAAQPPRTVDTVKVIGRVDDLVGSASGASGGRAGRRRRRRALPSGGAEAGARVTRLALV